MKESEYSEEGKIRGKELEQGIKTLFTEAKKKQFLGKSMTDKEKIEVLQDKMRAKYKNDEIINEDSIQTPESVFLSGIIQNDVFFHTIFYFKNGKYHPVVVTSTGHLIHVQNHHSDLMVKAAKKKNELREIPNFFYFDFGGRRFKYRQDELDFRDDLNIHTTDNEVFKMIHQEINYEIYDDLKDIIAEFYDHNEDKEYDVAVVNCIETYLHRALGKTFYVIFQGKEDTGKSTLQKILCLLQHFGLFGGKGTIPLMVRLTHLFGCAINLDEYDKLPPEEKKIATGVLNTGLYQDGRYAITDMNKKKVIEQILMMNTYGKKSFSTNNLNQFDRSFLSRTYLLTAVRQGRKLMDINDLSSNQRAEFQKLRNDAFVYCLYNWKKIKDSIITVKNELEKKGIFGRKTDMNSIILGIIRHFKGDYYLEVMKYLEDKEGINKVDRSFSNESLVFDYLVKKCLQADAVIEVTNYDIKEFIEEERELSEDEMKGLANKIGWIIRNHGLIKKESSIKKGEKGRKKYVIEKRDLMDVLRRFQYSDKLSKLDKDPTSDQGSKTVKLVETVDGSTDFTVSTDLEPRSVDGNIHHKCHDCGKIPCYAWGENGDPLCLDCFNKGIK